MCNCKIYVYLISYIKMFGSWDFLSFAFREGWMSQNVCGSFSFLNVVSFPPRKVNHSNNCSRGVQNLRSGSILPSSHKMLLKQLCTSLTQVPHYLLFAPVLCLFVCLIDWWFYMEQTLYTRILQAHPYISAFPSRTGNMKIVSLQKNKLKKNLAFGGKFNWC